jgi:hypothetical protein
VNFVILMLENSAENFDGHRHHVEAVSELAEHELKHVVDVLFLTLDSVDERSLVFRRVAMERAPGRLDFLGHRC